MSDNPISNEQFLTTAELQTQHNDRLVRNENSFSEIPNGIPNESEPLEMNNNHLEATDDNASRTNAQSMITGDTITHEIQINQYLFSKWFVGELQGHIENMSRYLCEEFISMDQKIFIENYLKNPQILLTQGGFNMFLSILQYGQQKLERNNQESNTYQLAEQSNENGNQRVIGPTDDHNDHTPGEIAALTGTNTSLTVMPKDLPSSTTSMSLSKLLLDKVEIRRGKILFNLTFIHQPKPFWHTRTINCLAVNDCPPIQSAAQRQYIVLEVEALAKYDKNNFFAYVQLLTYDNEVHPFKFIVPPKTIVEDSVVQKLTPNNSYGCDINSRTILYPLETIECEESEISDRSKNVEKSGDQNNSLDDSKRATIPKNVFLRLPVIMFNGYKEKRKTRRSNRTKSNANEDDMERIELNEYIEDELHKICKLRIQIVRLTISGQFEYVSEYIDTNLIQESKGTEELQPIDSSKIVPPEVCDCGDEEIIVPLNTNSEKAGFVIKINGKQLPSHKFSGIIQNSIKFKPPPKKELETNDFNLIIAKRNVLKTIMQSCNPNEIILEETLLNTKIKYLNHNEDSEHDHCNKKRKTKRKNSIK